MAEMELNTHIFKCKKHRLDSDPDCLTCSIVKAENAHIGMLLLKDEEKEDK